MDEYIGKGKYRILLSERGKIITSDNLLSDPIVQYERWDFYVVSF